MEKYPLWDQSAAIMERRWHLVLWERAEFAVHGKNKRIIKLYAIFKVTGGGH
jgi:hypothetical protein